ncbi:MAG: alanine--tRNA ligase [Actinobacteria bacterium]|nr:alanine--tRNA ligase [Actinomycetota bacterium]MCB9412441.1 alanine--tRNA ligase [Actinomycetota bacterium]
MDSAEIRRRFLDFFAERGHTKVPSASLILDDPTLLFVNAGMVPFKPYFLGEAVAPYPRATSVQKVVRTLDIEEVGKTTRHASFFQMCGNFSFGDYFKARAIPLAWELLTTPVDQGGYGLPGEKLWVTVYEDDDEAVELWQNLVGLPPERIQRRGMEDNFWSMGVPGPCGPCSEIYYDRGPEYGREGGPIADEDRYLEVWNLVFMQFARGEGTSKTDFEILGDLPAQNIDTGLGLERMAAILQGVDNIYEIDTSRAVLDVAAEITGKRYGTDGKDDIALRVVTDHVRTCTFLIADGVLPGNEGRGYVLRRLLRRVVRNMRLLGATGPTLAQLVNRVIDSMAPQYPELATDRNRLVSVAVGEESAFLDTLAKGENLFDAAVSTLRGQGGKVLPGADAFTLHDTYGFPIDLTMEMAAEVGLEVDREGFTRLMGEQRERAKADARARKAGLTSTTVYREIMAAGGTTEFTGYREVASGASVAGIVRDGESVPAAHEGETVEIVLDRSPFYAESGGQLGDHGVIELADGARVDVFDVQTPVPGLWVHRGTVSNGVIERGSAALGTIDMDRRRAISRAHTATHVIHKAFRERLGETATQMGSENAPGRLRFDFPSSGPVPADVLAEVESRVNEVLLDDLPVFAQQMKIEQARAMGAMALFGEKYGDQVRVISIGDWAHELCGGTHALRSGQLGVVSFLSEGSIGAGVRRLEALVGADAYRFLAREHALVTQLTELVKTRPEDLPARIESLMVKLKEAEKDISRYKSAQLSANIEGIIGSGMDIGDVRLWTFTAPADMVPKDLRDLVVRAKGLTRTDRPVAIVGATVHDGKVALVAAANDRAQERGMPAKELLAAALPAVNGRGGGKNDVAQGGGTNAEGLSQALADVVSWVEEFVGAT